MGKIAHCVGSAWNVAVSVEPSGVRMDKKKEFRLNRSLNDFTWHNCTHSQGRPTPYWLVCKKCAIAWAQTEGAKDEELSQ